MYIYIYTLYIYMPEKLEIVIITIISHLGIVTLSTHHSQARPNEVVIHNSSLHVYIYIPKYMLAIKAICAKNGLEIPPFFEDTFGSYNSMI